MHRRHRSGLPVRLTTCVAALLLLLSGLPPAPVQAQGATELFFSEYIEGSSNNKAIEIFNGTGVPVNLATGVYTLELYSNGSPTVSQSVALTGTVAAGDVYVVSRSDANSQITDQADQISSSVVNWNGDDAVVLRKAGVIVDVIGQIGTDPGMEWGTGLTSTMDNTIRRKPGVTAGDTNGSNAFDPALEWDGFLVDTFGGLGSHVFGDTAPTVSSTVPADEATNVSIESDITITFSESVNVTGSAFSLICGGAQTFAVTPASPAASFTLNPVANLPASTSCVVTVTASQVTDADTSDPPDTLDANYSFNFTTAAPGDVAPIVSTTVPANGATDVAVGSNITVNFTESVNVTPSAFALTCGVAQPFVVTPVSPAASFTLNPNANLPFGTACTVTVTATQVSDADGIDPPDEMEANYSFGFTTAAQPQPGPNRIHHIQGAQHLSPLVGAPVTNVYGIVTLKRQVAAGPARFGFFIQDTPANYDADEGTSEGILVFTNADQVPDVKLGDEVLVSGTVSEFRAAAANLSATQINASSAGIIVLSSNNTLPPARVVGTGGRVPPATVIDDDPGGDAETGTFDPANDGIDFWESLEGMRLQVNDAVATSPRADFTSSSTQELVVLGDGGANSNSRSARGGVILRCVPSLPGDVSRCDAESSGAQDDGVDYNPERIFLHAPMATSPDAQSSPPTHGLLNVSVNVRDSFPGQILGVLDYNFGNFKLLVTGVPTKTDGGLQKEVSPLTPDAGKLTIGSFNVENIDPGDPASKFADIAGVIVNNMRSPDVVGVEEVQDNNGPTNNGVVAADQTYALLIDAIVAAGGPQYQFRQVDPINNAEGGEPGGNIRVGFLFNPARVQFVDLTGPGSTSTGNTSITTFGGKPHLDSSPGRLQDPDPASAVYPNGAVNAFGSSRRPLVGEFTFNGNTVFVLNNHFNSKGGDQSSFGRNQPQVLSSENQRREQARIVRDFVTDILEIDPAANVVVLGDFNDFHFSRPLSILETLEGQLPASQRLHDLLETLDEGDRYTYIFDGNSQSLDGGILVSNNLRNNAGFEYDVLHVNAEFQDQVSDHEPQVVRFTLGAAPGRAEATLTPDLLDFGDVPVGATPSPTRTVVLTNTGLVPLNVTALTLDGGHADQFAIVSPSAPFVLHSGRSQTIVVKFAPTSKGQKTARLAVADNAPGERRVTLRGTGQGPEAAIAPDRVGFGRVLVNTQAAPRTVTIFNTGLAPLRVDAIGVTGAEASAFPLSGLPTFPATIQPGQTRTVSVGFNPTQRKGYSARIEVSHNGTGELRVPVNGQGVLANEGGGTPPRPEANLSPNQIGFGDVPLGSTGGPRTVMLFNTGDAPLAVNAIVIDGPQAGDFLLTPVTLPTSVAPGAYLSLEVRFKPTARGQRSASLRVADNANGGERRTTLRGVGQGPEATITPNAINFGQLTTGTSQSRSATIVNTGLAPLTITSVAITGGGAGAYQVTPAGTSTVAPGGSLTLTVTCTPSGPGNNAARLEVNDDATGERRVNLSCRGT